MKKIWNRLFERDFKCTEIGRFRTAKQIFYSVSGKLPAVSGYAAVEAQLAKMNFAHGVCKILAMDEFSTQCVEN